MAHPYLFAFVLSFFCGFTVGIRVFGLPDGRVLPDGRADIDVALLVYTICGLFMAALSFAVTYAVIGW